MNDHQHLLFNPIRGYHKKQLKLRRVRFNNDPTPIPVTNAYELRILSQNVQGFKNASKIDQAIALMEDHRIDIFLAQETWLAGDFTRIINGHLFIHHGINESSSHRGEREVAIILSPTTTIAYKNARNIPPFTSSTNQSIIASSRAIAIQLTFKGALYNNKRAFRRNRIKHITKKIIVASLYYPYKPSEHKEFLDFAQDFFNSFNRRAIIIIGQDSNAEVGIAKQGDIGLGIYGHSNINGKGIGLRDMIQVMGWFITNTMFQHNIYTTWKNFNAEINSDHQIDHIISNQHGLKQITDCKVSSLGVPSDHSGLVTSLIIKETHQPKRLIRKIIKWDLLTQDSYKHQFNEAISHHLPPEGNINMDDFCSALTSAGKEILSREETNDIGWFETSRKELLPLINERNEILFAARSSENSITLKQKCIDARNNVKDAVKAAKSKWKTMLANRMRNINTTPKDAWEAITTLK